MKPDCSKHKKDLFRQTDMKVVAEAIGDLHYETLSELFKELREKFFRDYKIDSDAGRDELAMCLWDASVDAGSISLFIDRAWQISKPFMDKQEGGK